MLQMLAGGGEHDGSAVRAHRAIGGEISREPPVQVRDSFVDRREILEEGLRHLINPCGYAMDYINGSYTRAARISLDPRVPLVHLRWYKVPANTPWFPHKNLFASMDWFPDEFLINPGIGEISLEKQWVPDEAPRPYSHGCFLGRPEWYTEGVPFSALNGPVPLPHCCSGPERALGGARFGGWGVVGTNP